jgi:uncharacterized membrane protein
MSLLVRAGNLEYDRVLFFSDAIFAIAITLLVLEIPRVAGEGTSKELAGSVHPIISFGISFVVIGMFWMGHHSLFRFITLMDHRLVALNLLFCGIIAFLPYPTALLNEPGKQPPLATIFYAACIAAAGLAELAIWLWATRGNGRLTPDLNAADRRYIALRLVRVPVVFLLSIPIALVNPNAATFFWLLIAVTGSALDRYVRPAMLAADPET